MRRGLTLVEVLVSLALLALVCGSTLLVYSSLLAATRKTPANQDALACLETVSRVFQERMRASWPNPPGPVPIQDTFQGFTYGVDDLGLMANPLPAGGTLQLKKLQVTVDYPIVGRDGHQSLGQYRSTVLVAR